MTPPSSGTPSPADEAERERVMAEAISRLAEWTGTSESAIQPGSVEAVQWPSACIGVPRPGIACADVITPGYRITLGIQGEPQYVHASREGRYAWAPAFDAQRTVEAVDVAASSITFEALTGSDEMGRVHRVVPGSRLDIPLRDLQPGQRVHVAVSFPVSPEVDAGVVVWLVPLD